MAAIVESRACISGVWIGGLVGLEEIGRSVGLTVILLFDVVPMLCCVFWVYVCLVDLCYVLVLNFLQYLHVS